MRGVKTAALYNTALVVGNKRLDYGSLRVRSHIDRIGVFPQYLRVAVLAGLSLYYSEQPVYRNIQECEFSLAAWRYSNVSTTGNIFTIGATQKIPLSNGTYIKSPSVAFFAEPLAEVLPSPSPVRSVRRELCHPRTSVEKQKAISYASRSAKYPSESQSHLASRYSR